MAGTPPWHVEKEGKVKAESVTDSTSATVSQKEGNPKETATGADARQSVKKERLFYGKTTCKNLAQEK